MNGKPTIKPGWIVLVGMVLGIAGMFIGYLFSRSQLREVYQAEAVKAGHARYVITDEFGRTSFEWKESCLPVKIESSK